MKTLSGKNVLIIGGGSGMGAATALLLAQKGAHVAIAGRRSEALQEVVAQKKNGEFIVAQTADVSDRESLETLFLWFDEQLGKLDVLVHAAGINIPERSLERLSSEDWD
ncbi:MAG: oxidoreductase, partial [Opitutae bacterium]|nr:oxidoreductase [Opitutae bacterium]